LATKRLHSEPKILSAHPQIEQLVKLMVYCSKCGTQNPDTATTCSNCGSPLQATYGANPQDWRYNRHQQHRQEHEYSRRNNGIGLLIGGLVILVIGLALLYGQFWIIVTYFWPIVLVVLGIWLLIRGLMYSQRRNR
jgi:ribosomal protein L40E